MIMYLSKGTISKTLAKNHLSVFSCGQKHKLNGDLASLWLDGYYGPTQISDNNKEESLSYLEKLGLVHVSEEQGFLALYRILTGCVICPVRPKIPKVMLSKSEKLCWRWIRHAGLRLTMAELTFLREKDIKPVSKLLGEENRQALTESIYTTETIFDGILENMMEHSPARDETVRAVLRLLERKLLFLV